MVTRYGGRKEPTMHCFMSHCAHPPPQHPPPPLSQFRIISAANAGRPEVGFHVTAGFPQQQGGGAGPPNAPQLRGIHHPHHGGNPSIPPQQPPPQAQSQHTGGPTGPAPTSTPPGPAEMGKQGPPHMQGQPQMQQGGQVQSFVPLQPRASGSQPFYPNPRAQGPRIPNHRNPVVNMQPTNVGQQMFPQHVQVSQMQVYGQQVMTQPIQPPPMLVQSPQFSVYNQQRHQNNTAGGYYPQNSQLTMMMPTHHQYPTFQPAPSPQFYYQGAVGLPRPGSGVTGAPGPGSLAGAASQQVIPGGGPPTQLGQGGSVVSLVQPVGVPGLSAGDTTTGHPTTSTTTSKQGRRKFALDIVDPKTMKNVNVYDLNTTSSSTPPRSGESSARETPQPNSGPGAMDVAADFAARVAKAASEKTPPSPSPPSETPVYEESPPATNGPDPLVTNSIPPSEGLPMVSDAPSPSNQQIVVIDESIDPMAPSAISPVAGTPASWKQSPVTSTSLASKPSGNSSKSDISNQAAAADEKILEIEPTMVVEFVPSVSATDIKDSELTPVVSAQTNAPVVDVVRREQFPVLKPSAPTHQSPRRKQQLPQSQRPETASNIPQAAPVTLTPSVPTMLPPVSRETTPTADVKVSKKPSPVEEPAPPSSAFPISQPPKEKRDQEKPHGRDREKSSSISSQGRGEREKSVSSTSSSSSTGRDRDKSSRDKEKGKDRDKSASQGRDRDKSSTKEATPVETIAPAEEPKQQTNGEMTTTEVTETGKASQRSKPKPRHQKMRDLNRKGAEKEGGTDMDAFMEPASEETAPPTTLPAPPSTQAPAAPVATANKITDNQIVKDEDTETDKEEKLVAARNEENAKVSAAALKEDTSSSSTPVIENIPAPKPTTLTLRHTYKEDQWSPLNPEGKKKYERDFLMELQNDPQSKRKPDNIPPDIEVVLKDSTNRRMVERPFPNMNRTVPDRSAHDNFTPGFLRAQNSRGQTVPKRNSQQGKPKGNKPNVIHLSLSLKEEVKLRETENAWKPTRMKIVPNNEQETKTEELYKKVRGVLNKLTPQKFQTLVSQVQSLPIDNSERLQGVINLVFEKAVDEPNFAVAYANMCKVLSSMQVKAERKSKDDPEFVNFRKLLVNRCQQEFEKNSEVELNREARLKEIEDATDPEKKKELQATFEEEERRIRMKSVGNIRFIGELFKFGMLTTNIMQRCIKHLLTEGDAESLECLCKLLTTIGKDLESKNQNLDFCFNKMREISQKKGEVSSRVRFMLQDVIELKRNRWIPRRDDSNPKTMDQIQKEAEKEVMDQQLLINSAPQTPRRMDDRSSSNRKNRGGGMNEDGWATVAPRGQTSKNFNVETAKFKNIRDESNLSLGASTQFKHWGAGASGKGKDQGKKPMVGGPSSSTNSPYSSNFYAALDNTGDDIKRPAPLIGGSIGSGLGKTPSLTLEKERLLQHFKSSVEAENRQTRGGASRSSSRENSARGNANEPTSIQPFAPSSQPSSVSASTEDISSIAPASKTSTAPAAATETLPQQSVQKKTLSLLEEFLFNTNFKESEILFLESFSVESHSEFVCESLNDMLERRSNARGAIGKLLSYLVKAGVLALSAYIAGLNEYLKYADDIAIDVPKFWPYTAEVVEPMLSSEALPFSSLHEIAQPSLGKLIPEILELLVKDKGPGWIREKWEAAGLKLTDFIPAEEVNSFVEKHNLEYLTGGAASAPSSSSSASLNWDHVQNKLEQFLKLEQGSSPSISDQTCDWIDANVGDRVKEPQFIRALMTAICQSSIESQKTTLKLNEPRFQRLLKLVLKYVDTKEERELQCLYAVQSLINKLEHPQGLLCQIFQGLWDDGAISNDSFIAWEASTDPAEQAGKGVALKSLTTFFTALREGEEDSSCEES